MLLDRGSDLLASELASLWPCMLLGSGVPSAGLRSLPLLMSAPLLEGRLEFGHGTTVRGGTVIMA
jgi:hypothetical protein